MKRHKHSLSHYHLLTAEMGKLYPVGLYEVLPGDTVQQHTSALIRLSPPLRPVMHPVVVRFHTWFVPYRLLWDGFEEFITGGPDGEGGDSGAFPTITADATNGFTIKTLPDYMGCKPGSAAAGLVVSALPFRAYGEIWDKCYRDQDLQTKLDVSKASGNDTTTPLVVQSVAWEKDRFTAARPWPQKGPDVVLPLGTSAPVVGASNSAVQFAQGTPAGAQVSLTGDSSNTPKWATGATPSGDMFWPSTGTGTNLEARLDEATAATITDLRYAMSIQRYQEARALYGSEYVDYLRYLGIRPSDARLQRPEYLGGAKQTVSWSEIVQTSEPAEDNPLGQLGGHGISAMRTRPYRHFFEEHGICMTLMSVRPRSMYADGLHRMWSRRVKEDFWQKELENIGSEPVYSRELYAESDANGGDDVFGWADRYSDYRHIPSRISGDFRTSAMYDWHLARMFSSQPTLNGTFITCDPSDRIFADQTADADHLWCMVNHRITARRFVGRGGVGRVF